MSKPKTVIQVALIKSSGRRRNRLMNDYGFACPAPRMLARLSREASVERRLCRVMALLALEDNPAISRRL